MDPRHGGGRGEPPFGEELKTWLNQCPGTPQKQRECAGNFPPGFSVLENVCPTCLQRKGNFAPSTWFNHIWFLYALQRGGYPFGKNDLSIEEWIDLGIMREHLEGMKVING